MIRKFAMAAALTLTAGAASAQDCTAITVEDAFDLTEAQIDGLYECLQEKMATGYAKEGDEIATNYRSWAATASRPAVAGPHGNRLLNTYANDVAAEQYLKFEEEGVEMPIGSVLAKESITVSIKKKAARPGPLFIMTKVGLDEAPDTAGWLYAGLQPNGKVMKIKQSFCHDCHAGWEAQDFLGYPVPEVRLGQ
ncbi:cytochrome P460 family protein [uncultured Tateyamaria sp.]|uniref:cytochrome P460 family protein n=1 Tax=uncultured Tateyamaria sp. TaxID=455651 RepID=UPI00261CA30A|nr:cytochrome P460 family protein [uncultured Tateyamaria sp.]